MRLTDRGVPVGAFCPALSCYLISHERGETGAGRRCAACKRVRT